MAIPRSGGKDINIDCHPAGRNPGDVIKQGMHHGSSLSNKATHYEKALVKLGPKGANPGDVLKSWGADKNLEYHGDGKHNPAGQSPSDMKRSIIESFKKDPKGANPGDVVKHDMAVGRIGNFSYNDPLHTKEYHPAGRNPGDFWKTNPEYIIGIIAEKIRDFEDAHPDIDLGWLDEIIKDVVCADPSSDFLYPSDFWSLTTQPFTGYNPDLEHFAVFPESLVLKPLLATCPKEICKKCGKPRIRLTKTSYKKRWNRSSKEKQGNDGKAIDGFIHPNYGDFEGLKQVKTVGWSDCGCGVGFESGVVLDPFAGRGTVGKVAKQLGLHYILFDIKPEYCELARLYIRGQKHKLHRSQSKLNV